MANVRAPRRTANFAQAALYTVIFIAILVAINFLANRYNKTYDSTANKRYSLSEQSVKLVKDLKDTMVINYWDRPDGFERARGLFDRYQNLSTKIDVKYQDVDKNRTAAIAAGISALGTITVEVGNKRETAKTLTEEDVTSAMLRALKSGERKVCYTLGSGEAATDNTEGPGFARAKEMAEKNNYKTEIIKLLEKPEVPAGCTVVIVAGPRRDLIQPAVDALKKYVEGGGHAMFLLDPPLKFGQGVDDNEALTTMLAGWGITAHKDLVLDTSGVGQLFGLGPEAPLVTKYEGHPIVTAMKDVPTLFPLTRSLEIKDAPGTKVSSLLATAEESRATSNLASPSINISSAAAKGPFILAAAGEHTASKGRYLVVGTSSFAANRFIGFNGNRDLFMNMVNWLSADEDVMAIRPKDPEDRPLNMNARQVTLLFWSSVFGLPLIVVMAGLSVWWRRR